MTAARAVHPRRTNPTIQRAAPARRDGIGPEKRGSEYGSLLRREDGKGVDPGADVRSLIGDFSGSLVAGFDVRSTGGESAGSPAAVAGSLGETVASVAAASGLSADGLSPDATTMLSLAAGSETRPGDDGLD